MILILYYKVHSKRATPLRIICKLRLINKLVNFWLSSPTVLIPRNEEQKELFSFAQGDTLLVVVKVNQKRDDVVFNQ